MAKSSRLRAQWDTLGGRLEWAIERQPPEGRSRGIGLLIRKLGDVPGANYPSISGYLHDEVDPPLEFLEKAAEALGVGKRWLAFGGPDPDPKRDEPDRGEGSAPDLWEGLLELLPWLEGARGSVGGAFAELLDRAGRYAAIFELSRFGLGGDDGFAFFVRDFLEDPIEYWTKVAGEEAGDGLRLDRDLGSDYALAMLHALSLSVEVAFRAIADAQLEREEAEDG